MLLEWNRMEGQLYFHRALSSVRNIRISILYRMCVCVYAYCTVLMFRTAQMIAYDRKGRGEWLKHGKPVEKTRETAVDNAKMVKIVMAKNRCTRNGIAFARRANNKNVTTFSIKRPCTRRVRGSRRLTFILTACERHEQQLPGRKVSTTLCLSTRRFVFVWACIQEEDDDDDALGIKNMPRSILHAQVAAAAAAAEVCRATGAPEASRFPRRRRDPKPFPSGSPVLQYTPLQFLRPSNPFPSSSPVPSAPTRCTVVSCQKKKKTKRAFIIRKKCEHFWKCIYVFYFYDRRGKKRFTYVQRNKQQRIIQNR